MSEMERRHLGIQAFVHGEEPSPDRFDPPTNSDRMVNKPDGGLWTSTFREDGSCAWLDWCQAEHWGLSEESLLYALEPEPDILVVEIDSEADLHRIVDEWERDDLDRMVSRMYAPLDFEAIATEYDAIHLTGNGQRETRFATPGLYGWDTECTLWLRWSFSAVECLGPVESWIDRTNS